MIDSELISCRFLEILARSADRLIRVPSEPRALLNARRRRGLQAVHIRVNVGKSDKPDAADQIRRDRALIHETIGRALTPTGIPACSLDVALSGDRHFRFGAGGGGGVAD